MKRYIRAAVLDITEEDLATRADFAKGDNLDFIAVLSNDPNSGIRRCVASNPNTPTAILLNLLNDPYPFVRIDAINNPNFPKQYSEVAHNSLQNHADEVLDSYIIRYDCSFDEIKEVLHTNAMRFLRSRGYTILSEYIECLVSDICEYEITIAFPTCYANVKDNKNELERIFNNHSLCCEVMAHTTERLLKPIENL